MVGVRAPIEIVLVTVLGCGAAASSAGPPQTTIGLDDDAEVLRCASIWDAPERDSWQRPVEAMVLLGAEPGDTVVDLGSGTGYFLPFLSIAVGERGHVVALDSDPRMIDHIRARAGLEGLANVEARIVGPESPALAPGSIDHVIVVDTWHDLPERALYAVQLRDALRPGGSVLVIDFTADAPHGPPAEQRISPEAVALDLTSAGFEVQILVEGMIEQYAVRGTLPLRAARR